MLASSAATARVGGIKKESVLRVAKALQDAGVRYLVVGGVAVNLHGRQRHTKDLDLVIGLERMKCEAGRDHDLLDAGVLEELIKEGE